MPILFPCPACKRAQRASRKFKGMRWRCPDCGIETLVPAGPPGAAESESGEDAAALANTMASAAPAPAPSAAHDPARAALETEMLKVEVERARLEIERAQLARKMERAQAASEQECDACAEPIKARAKVCKHCGHVVGERVPRRSSSRSPRAGASPVGPVQPDPRLAVILTVALGPMFGWWYAGGCGMGALGAVCSLVIFAMAGAAADVSRSPLFGAVVLVAGHVLCAFLASGMCAAPRRNEVDRTRLAGSFLAATLIMLAIAAFASSQRGGPAEIPPVRRWRSDDDLERDYRDQTAREEAQQKADAEQARRAFEARKRGG